jgi:hypothetical protein
LRTILKLEYKLDIQEIRDNQEKIDELLNNLEDKILEGKDSDFDDEEFEEDEDDQ